MITNIPLADAMMVDIREDLCYKKYHFASRLNPNSYMVSRSYVEQ
jgi:hypothetical protein